METSQYINNLMPPKGQVDVILDTDAFNEIDDQYAIAYLLACGEKLNIKGFCAAPFRFSSGWYGTQLSGNTENSEISRTDGVSG